MAKRITRRIDDELKATNKLGGYHGSIVCTDQGLLVAAAGDIPSEEALAGFASLFDEVVTRGARHLDLAHIEEATVLDAVAGRLVIRPVFPNEAQVAAGSRLFVVIWMTAEATWRRNAGRLIVRLRELLAASAVPSDVSASPAVGGGDVSASPAVGASEALAEA